MKTSIGNIKEIITSSINMINSFSGNPFIEVCEDYVYELEIINIKDQIRQEIVKSKELINGNKHRAKRKN